MKLIDFMDNAIECTPSKNSPKSQRCIGYVRLKNSSRKGKQITRCLECKKDKKRTDDAKRRKEQIRAKRAARLQLNARRKKSLEMKNERLRNKVKLKINIIIMK